MQKLSLEVDSIVAEMAPPAGAIGMLSSDDVTRLLRQAATRGAMAGWVQGERTARLYWSKELDILNRSCRSLRRQNTELDIVLSRVAAMVDPVDQSLADEIRTKGRVYGIQGIDV